MNYKIRELDKKEISVLDDFLYEAIFLPDDSIVLPRNIIEKPELQVYIENWGKPDDLCLVAECENKIVGAVWTRIMNDYGHIDNQTPSLAISLYKNYRNKGIGTAIMEAILRLLKSKGYSQVSLAVQKENYAVKMYKKVGFKIVNQNSEEYIMLCTLQN